MRRMITEEEEEREGEEVEDQLFMCFNNYIILILQCIAETGTHSNSAVTTRVVYYGTWLKIMAAPFTFCDDNHGCVS